MQLTLLPPESGRFTYIGWLDRWMERKKNGKLDITSPDGCYSTGFINKKLFTPKVSRPKVLQSSTPSLTAIGYSHNCKRFLFFFLLLLLLWHSFNSSLLISLLECLLAMIAPATPLSFTWKPIKNNEISQRMKRKAIRVNDGTECIRINGWVKWTYKQRLLFTYNRLIIGIVTCACASWLAASYNTEKSQSPGLK